MRPVWRAPVANGNHTCARRTSKNKIGMMKLWIHAKDFCFNTNFLREVLVEKNENSQKQQFSEIFSHICWHLTILICFAFPDAWYVTLLWCQISKQWIALGTSWCSGYPYRITSFKTSWVQTLQRLLELLCQRFAVMGTFDNDPGLKLYAFNPLNHGGNKKVTHI